VFVCSLTPHRCDSFNLESVVISENFPLTAVSVFAAAGPDYMHALSQVVSRANAVYANFMRSEEGQGFSGQVGVIALEQGQVARRRKAKPQIHLFIKLKSIFSTLKSEIMSNFGICDLLFYCERLTIRYDTIDDLHWKTDRPGQFNLAHELKKAKDF